MQVDKVRGLETQVSQHLHGQFNSSLASTIFYYINCGLEVYEDCNFSPDHGPMVVDRLQKKVFPELSRFPDIDMIIGDCWHGRFTSIAHLRETIVTQIARGYEAPKAMSEMEYATKRDNCRQLLNEGILDACPQEDR